MDIINKIYDNLERLPYQLQAEACDFIEYLVFKNEQSHLLDKTSGDTKVSSDNQENLSLSHRSIQELRGLGKQVWQDVSVKEHINAERDSWNG
ncbi:DUF2281 domain-containing protein [Candidatus Halobeggiatoa sp. HSG11]|nr:DUF2281 domain-containing protein [Candidatus Halobeggiatoa sp. HSG11]